MRLSRLMAGLREGRALALAHEQVLAGDSRTRRASGAYYTPWHLARFVVGATLGPATLGPGEGQAAGRAPVVVDPAAGAGTFLLAAAAVAPGARLLGVDLDARAAEVCRQALAPAGAGTTILSGDALLLDWPAVFPALFGPGGEPLADAVVGNPPYYSCQRLSPAMQAALRARWPDIYDGQNDVLYYFVRLGAGLLRPGGRLGYVVARYFAESAHARRLRRWILDHCAVEQWIDFRNVQLFPGADVLTGVLVLRREPDAAARAAQQVRLVRVQRWTGRPARLLAHLRALAGTGGYEGEFVDIYTRRQSGWDEGPWEAPPPRSARVLAAAGRSAVPLGELCRIGQGMKSGLNRVFVLAPETAAAHGLEPELLRPYVKTRDLHRWHCRWRGLYLLDVRNDTPLDRYPAARRYLEQHRPALAARYQARTGVCRWYALSLPQNAALFDAGGVKLMTAAYARGSRFALDPGRGFYSLTDTYAIVPEAGAGVTALYLLGLLNSRAGEFLHRQAAKLKRDGYCEYVAGTLARFPVPLPARDPAAAAALEAAAGALAAAHEGGPPPPAVVAELERAVDTAAYRLYGLGPAEMAEIERAVVR